MVNISSLANNTISIEAADASTQPDSAMDQSVSDIIATFNSVTANMLTATSINKVNTNSSENPASVSAAITGGFTISTSSDGKLASPISAPVSSSQLVKSEAVDRTDDKGNIIRLGEIAYKDAS